MSVIVTDTGFGPDDWTGGFSGCDAETTPGVALDLPSDTPEDQLDAQLMAAPMLRIAFPSAADGRGFTLARLLRLRGYSGRLRAFGHVIADQYAMARRSGFDEVEISEDLAARQPEDQWLFRADWQEHNYQARLRG